MDDPTVKHERPSSGKDLTYAADIMFKGTYGSRRNKDYVHQRLQEVAKILDDLAVNEGVTCVVVGTADYVKNNQGVYLPLVPKSTKDMTYFKNIITPIIEKRMGLHKKWLDHQNARMGFTLSA